MCDEHDSVGDSVTCFWNNRFLYNVNNLGMVDYGFAGTTHALSAVALFLWGVAFYPQWVFTALNSSNTWLVGLALLNVVGGSLYVDLDNTNSTAKSNLGVIGGALSVLFRASSSVVQVTIRSKYDDDEPDPHRGFYHTIIGQALLSFLLFLSMMIPSKVSLPLIGDTTMGNITAIILTWCGLQLFLASLFKPTLKKMKKKAGDLGDLLALIISLGFTIYMMQQLPQNTGYSWIAISIFAGMVIHTLGDCFTAYGSPILFPIKVKGKRWYRFRLIGIQSGGFIENAIFIPVFFILSLIAGLKVIQLLF